MDKETKFKINYDENRIEFSNGTICHIDYDTDSFEYCGHIFSMQSDVEKDLEYNLKKRFVDITNRDN